MRCYEFEAVVLDIVSGRLMEVRLKQAALTHAETCPKCGLRLEQEHQLTAGLRALAAQTDLAKAPPKLNPELQAAFRTQFPNQIQKPQLHQVWKKHEWLALAAGLVLLLTGTGLIWILVQPGPASQIAVSEAPDSLLPSRPTLQAGVKPSESTSQRTVVEPHVILPPTQKLPGSRQTPRSKPIKPQSRVETLDDFSNEFIPLTYVAASTAMDSGQIVQMYISRSTLISMGLSTNVENAADYVKAQVIMSDDGVPRSIRILPE